MPCARYARTMLEPIMYCARTTNAHSASVPFCPKLLKNICAIGWPIGESKIPSKSVPMQNASDTLIAAPHKIQTESSFAEAYITMVRTPSENTCNSYGHNDGPWDSSRCVASLLTDMYARVERAFSNKDGGLAFPEIKAAMH